MVKLVCCDVDNTLLFDKNGSVSDEMFSVIDRLCRKGILFAAVSGRPVADMLRIFAPVADRIIIASFDGAIVLYKGSLLFERSVDRDVYMAFVKSFEAAAGKVSGASGEYIIYTAGEAYVKSPRGIASNALRDSVTMTGRVKEGIDAERIDAPVYKISVCTEAVADFDYIVKDWSLYLNNIYSGNKWCEFVAKDIDKGYAVSMIMERFGLAREETMAFGDGENDIPMLSACGFSYAMESASADTKAAAGFVTDDVSRSIKEFFKLD